ncbi:MAG: sigma-70 family RNA polymerase sigma factor [Actinomycetota bacterium]|nr:sigma-70 family RNA polymerase sigma factor [Actinomycetota bacterium]
MNEPHPEVVRDAQSGDLESFAELVRAYQADVWRLARHLLRDPTAADDVTQDTFVRAYRFLRRYRGDSKFSTWLFSIARNCALDEIRRSGRNQRVAGRVRAEPHEPDPPPVKRLEIREALQELSVELREPVVLIDMLGASYKEASETLATPVGTVKSRVHRAREQLAHLLLAEEEGAGEL